MLDLFLLDKGIVKRASSRRKARFDFRNFLLHRPLPQSRRPATSSAVIIPFSALLVLTVSVLLVAVVFRKRRRDGCEGSTRLRTHEKTHSRLERDSRAVISIQNVNEVDERVRIPESEIDGGMRFRRGTKNENNGGSTHLRL